MKKKSIGSMIFSAGVLTLFAPVSIKAAGLEVETSDVITVVKNCIPYVAVFLAIVVALIVICVIARKFELKKKKIVRGQSLCVGVLAFVVMLNFLCVGPLKTLLDVVGNPARQVSDDTKKEAEEMARLGEEWPDLLNRLTGQYHIIDM